MVVCAEDAVGYVATNVDEDECGLDVTAGSRRLRAIEAGEALVVSSGAAKWFQVAWRRDRLVACTCIFSLSLSLSTSFSSTAKPTDLPPPPAAAADC